jgi:hypothetical protein
MAKKMGWPSLMNLQEARDFVGLSPHYYLQRKNGPVEVIHYNAGMFLLAVFKEEFLAKYCTTTTMSCQRMWDTTKLGVNLDGARISHDTYRALVERLRLFLELKSTDRVAFDAPKLRDKLVNLMVKPQSSAKAWMTTLRSSEVGIAARMSWRRKRMSASSTSALPGSGRKGSKLAPPWSLTPEMSSRCYRLCPAGLKMSCAGSC